MDANKINSDENSDEKVKTASQSKITNFLPSDEHAKKTVVRKMKVMALIRKVKQCIAESAPAKYPQEKSAMNQNQEGKSKKTSRESDSIKLSSCHDVMQ